MAAANVQFEAAKKLAEENARLINQSLAAGGLVGVPKPTAGGGGGKSRTTNLEAFKEELKQWVFALIVL